MSATIGQTIAAAASLTRSYAELMLKDVKPDAAGRFASPGGVVVVSNHPVFVFGHLALYNRRVLAMCECAEGVAAVDPSWDALFKAGAECRNDSAGSIYPPLAEVSGKYFAGFDAALAAVKAADDAVLNLPNPAEGRMKELFPLRGQVINFLMSGHPMSHLGQVSAWRRMMGLASAM